MAKSPNTKNAHVRNGGNDTPKEQVAGDYQRLLNDPAFDRAFGELRDALMYQLENFQGDGTAESEDLQLEICRCLRTLNGVKRTMSVTIQRLQLNKVPPISREMMDELIAAQTSQKVN